jgi:basic membrane protein A and related proteins
MQQRRWVRLVAAALGLVLVTATAACGSDDNNNASSSGGSSGSSFKGCQVTDLGGVDDKSFNQTAYKGLQDAGKELNFDPKVLESKSEADYAANIQAFLEQKCDIIITVGFLLGNATADAAKANPDQKFAIVDNDLFDTATNKDRNFDNVAELVFSTDQAAFLAGYAAAAMSKTGKLGTYGGQNIPTVTIFMKGFELGMEQYNKDNSKNVKLIGWSNAKNDGLFTGDFEDQAKGRATTQTLLDQGADIIMPVAGPVGQGSIKAIQDANSDAKLIWVDTDGCVSVSASCDLFLTSVMKNMDVAVKDVTVAAQKGTFKGGTNQGTLANDGVAIAPFHDFDSKVPQAVKDRIDELKQQIIDGKVQTSPPSS